MLYLVRLIAGFVLVFSLMTVLIVLFGNLRSGGGPAPISIRLITAGVFAAIGVAAAVVWWVTLWANKG